MLFFLRNASPVSSGNVSGSSRERLFSFAKKDAIEAKEYLHVQQIPCFPGFAGRFPVRVPGESSSSVLLLLLILNACLYSVYAESMPQMYA
jgi:hypothetical protein